MFHEVCGIVAVVWAIPTLQMIASSSQQLHVMKIVI